MVRIVIKPEYAYLYKQQPKNQMTKKGVEQPKTLKSKISSAAATFSEYILIDAKPSKTVELVKELMRIFL